LSRLLLLGVRVMGINAIFNNISAISCRSVLLVEETGVNHRLFEGVVVIVRYWIYNFLCKQYLSPLKLLVRIPAHGEVYSIQLYVIKFVSNLRQSRWFKTLLTTQETKYAIKIQIKILQCPLKLRFPYVQC
jgi:hypothetical protein